MRRAGRREGRRDEAIDTNPVTPVQHLLICILPCLARPPSVGVPTPNCIILIISTLAC